MAKIQQIIGREVIDSRGTPTLQATVICEGGIMGSAMVPSGASTGIHEAHELRDGDPKRYSGNGVLAAVSNVNTKIHTALLGQDTANQSKVDRRMMELDGTPNKQHLGANAILAVSLACARAEAAHQTLPLYVYLQQLFPKRKPLMPVPQMNLINGGAHASNGLSIQEFQVLPIGAKDFATALRMGVEIHLALKKLLLASGFQTEVGDEGGFAPKLSKSEDAFILITRAIENAGYVPGVDVYIGIDAAASEFYDAERAGYMIDGALLQSNDLAYRYKMWRELYPIISIEDPFEQDAFQDFQQFSLNNGNALQVVGDDLYVTNTTRIKQGIANNATNAVLIKPNQIGTLSETLQAILIAQEAGQNVVISHRSGETEDTFIADLAVSVGAGQIKTGAPSRSDRTSKYNRLLQIEDEIHPQMGHDLQKFLEHHIPNYKQSHEEISFIPTRSI
ncbi:MAG: phosphopyruvate hydratase [bacterium]|nr:phosphopyruvate hydratase [bacterium]